MKQLQPSYLLFMLLLIANLAYSQSDNKAKIDKANNLLNQYIKSTRFDKGVIDESFRQFQSLFTTDAKIVFDIPFRNMERQNSEIKRISRDDRQQYQVISMYGKSLSVALYIDIIVQENSKESRQLSSLDYNIINTGKKDTRKIAGDTIIYEVSKQFYDNSWSIASNEKYLVSIRFENGNPLIFNISRNDEKTTELDLLFTLVDLSTHRKNEDYKLPGVKASFSIDFEEEINNINLKSTTDSIGQIKFVKNASKRSIVYLDTVQSINGIRYEIPYDWKNDGKNVSEQPFDGFTIGLRPYKWNGLAYSFFISAGAFIPDEVDKTHFQPNSNFNSQLGTKLGLSFNLTYFINHDRWKINPKVWLFGIGSGVSIDYQMAKVTSDGFEQQPYLYIDDDADDCEVVFKGNNFSESNSLVTLTFPLFIETKTKLGKKAALSIRLGANFSLPVSSTYKASGTFTRWGYYPPNPLPITNDDSLNYFTEKDINYSGDVVYNPILAEGFLRLNWFFNVFKKNPDNSLELGLMFAMPFSTSTNLTYTESRREEYDGYWMNIENDQYNSIAYATEKIYNYYFGISIGINLIKYRPR